jgi:hypothetical protein
MKRRSATWDLDPFEERLLQQLRDHVATREPTPDLAAATQRSPVRRRAIWRLRSVRSISALVAIAAAGVALVFALLSSGSTPTPALALPILNHASLALPAKAAQVARQETDSQTRNLQGGPVNTGSGRAFPTPWGRGYVLSDQARQIACVLMKPWGANWQIAECVGPQTATHGGGDGAQYWGRKHPNTGINVAIMASGGTLSAQPIGGRPHEVTLHGGVAVTLFHHTTVFTAQTDGHVQQSVDWAYPGFADGTGGGPPARLLRAVKRLDPKYP